jgi:hypothetical protein
MDIKTAEPLVPEPSLVEVKIAIGKLKSYTFSGTNQIPADQIKAVDETLSSELQKNYLFYMEKRNCHSSGRNQLLYQFKKGCVTD